MKTTIYTRGEKGTLFVGLDLPQRCNEVITT